MATRESQGNKKDEDPYDIDYYERTGGDEAGIQKQKTEEIQREIGNLEIMLNNISKHSLIRFVCLLVLGIVILALLAVLIVNTGGGAPSAGPGAEDTQSSGSTATCPPATTVTCPSCATPTAASDAGMNNISILSLSISYIPSNSGMFYLVFVVAGGIQGSNVLTSVEVLDTNGSSLCELPGLPTPREGLQLNGLTACGGRDRHANASTQDQTKTSCLTFSPAAGADWWAASHTLQHPPFLSWPSPEGLMMLGGDKTTEILTNNGGTIESFQLDYKIR